MLPAPVIAALVIAASFAAKQGTNEASSRSARFVTNLAAAPANYLQSILESATGQRSTRFDPSGPFSVAADAVQNFRLLFSHFTLTATQAEIGEPTEFSFFSKGKGIEITREAARHTISALCLWCSEPLKAFHTNDNMKMNQTTMNVLKSAEDIVNNIRLFLLPRANDAVFST
jgi:hypothetical protein